MTALRQRRSCDAGRSCRARGSRLGARRVRRARAQSTLTAAARSKLGGGRAALGRAGQASRRTKVRLQSARAPCACRRAPPRGPQRSHARGRPLEQRAGRAASLEVARRTLRQGGRPARHAAAIRGRRHGEAPRAARFWPAPRPWATRLHRPLRSGRSGRRRWRRRASVVGNVSGSRSGPPDGLRPGPRRDSARHRAGSRRRR